MTITIFAATDANNNVELWSTDGSTGRTTLLMDINPGATGSFPANSPSFGTDPGHASSFAVLNGVAYFSANDGTHGTELWRSDGTAAGTMAVTDFIGSTGGAAERLCARQHSRRQQSAVLQRQRANGLGVYSSTGVPGSTPTFLGAQPSGTRGFVASGSYVYTGSRRPVRPPAASTPPMAVRSSR